VPLLGFAKQFAPEVEAGRKLMTIRLRRKRPFRVGDRLYLYGGLRTKQCRKLGEATCAVVTCFHRPYRGRWKVTEFFDDLGRHDGRQRVLLPKELVLIAEADGFDDVEAFEDWFDQYGPDVLLDMVAWPEIEKAHGVEPSSNEEK